MHRRAIAATAISATALSLGGCVQMTRHSNTMVFGTNTSFGISVGSDATSTPALTIGYRRQEAVIMPLVANTVADGEMLNPCQQKADKSMPADCLLLGQATGPNGSDTYSVLASFGTKYDAGGTNPNANGSIAQYFATGLAARELARNGGAATIATSDAAGKSSLIGASPEALAEMARTRKSFPDIMARISVARANAAGKIRASAANYQVLLKTMDAAIGVGATDFEDLCQSAADAAACADLVSKPTSLQSLQPTEWESAVAVN